jgi:hypothetical protein
MEGAVRRLDRKASVLWSGVQRLQERVTTQYIERGDNCGCSQAADRSDRAARAHRRTRDLPLPRAARALVCVFRPVVPAYTGLHPS